jgi:hypothetical protein
MPFHAYSAAINLWSHHWLHSATKIDSEVIGTFYSRWRESLTLGRPRRTRAFRRTTSSRNSATWT